MSAPIFKPVHAASAPAAAPMPRQSIEDVCKTVLWLRSWWEAYGDVMRGRSQMAAAEIHDRLVDGSILARAVATDLGLNLDEQAIRNYSWGRSVQTLVRSPSKSSVDAGGAA